MAIALEWTVMLYVAADEGGIEFSPKTLLGELAAAPSGGALPRVNFVYEIATRKQTRRGRIAPDTLEDETLARGPRIDTTSPDQVTSFVDWATQAFPSRHTALILKGHGAGFDPPPGPVHTGLPTKEPGGERDGKIKIITNVGLRRAVEQTRARHVDLYCFDECDMNLVEILYELADVASFTVATFLEEGSDLFPYKVALELLSEPRYVSPRELAGAVARTAPSNAELVATELVWMGELFTALHELGVALNRWLRAYPKHRAALMAVQKEFAGARADLKRLLALLRTLPRCATLTPLIATADEVRKRASFASSPLNDIFGGMGIFFPPPEGSSSWALYGSLRFAQRNRWTQFLADYSWGNLP